MTTEHERVYFLQAESGGPVKIGRANDVEKRVVDIQRMPPVPLRVLAIAEGGAALETRLHQQFSELKQHGEWFTPAHSLLTLIRSYEAASDDNKQDNRIVQINFRAPESARDLLHEMARRLRHERGFEEELRNALSKDNKSYANELTNRVELLERLVAELRGQSTHTGGE